MRLYAEVRLGLGRLGYDEESACVLVDAMNQAHLRVVGVVAGQVAQMPGNGIDQRSVVISASGVYHHASRFVDDHQLFVLVYLVKGNVLRLNGVVVAWTVHHQCHRIARSYFVVAFYGAVVDMDKTGFGSFLNAVAAGVLEMLEEEFIYAGRHLSTVGHDAEMLVEKSVVLVLFGGGNFYILIVFQVFRNLKIVCRG